MSALSFVALELQTTHLDPASVSQASYVKLVNGNITLVDSWPVIPPTTTGDSDKESTHQTKTWDEALSQLTMMVGTLPVVSYYRDADKEVFQAASQHSGKTPPEFRWLDCRELAKTYLPDLPEFQLSTVLQALDLFDEYGDSNSVEQTSQIVIELARRHNVNSVEELWGELYDQQDKLLGLDAGLEGLNFAAVPPPTYQQHAEDASDELMSDEANVQEGSVSSVEEPATAEQQPDAEDAEELLDDTATFSDQPAEDSDPETPREVEHTDPADESASAPAEDSETPLAPGHSAAAELPEELVDEASSDEPEHDGVPVTTPVSAHEQPLSESEQLETSESPEDSCTAATPAVHVDREEDTVCASSTDAQDAHEPVAVAQASAEESEAPSHEVLEPADPVHEIVPAATATTQQRTENSSDISTFEVTEVAEHPVTQSEGPRKSRAIRTLGFFGVFVFGLLTVVGGVLTVMATMLFFTENSLMLETKIAGVILTGAISMLSLLMAVFSFKSFRDH